MDRVPNDMLVHAKVDVDQHVSHLAHIFPRDMRCSVGDSIGHATGCLTDECKVVDDGVDGLAVSRQALEIHACRVFLDSGDRLQEVLNPQLPSSRRHE